MSILWLCAPPLVAQDHNTYIQHAVRFAVSPPLRELAKLPQSPQYGLHEAEPVHRIPKPFVGKVVDSVEQRSVSGNGVAYTIAANFLGVGSGFPNYSVNFAPPDTTVAVGDTQIVQWVNIYYTVCSKTSPYACGPAILGNSLWNNLGGACAANNDGDIIAQWDVQAHRWLLSQNVLHGSYAVCLAISTSNDATGIYYLYEFPVVNGGFPDYPKWGVWVNNYGQAWNNFGPNRKNFVGPVFCAYNRTKLLAGDTTAEQICHQYTTLEDSLLPADIDSPTLPPSGQDQFAIGSVGEVDNSHLSVYSVHINNPNDWTQGAAFTGDEDSQLVAIAPFTPACQGTYDGSCVPQNGVSDLLDSLGSRLMYRLAYYEDTAAQHWYVNFDVTASGGQNAVRWMEFTAPNSVVGPTGISTFQQGTYAPDGNWRWMGSMARDQSNDVLLGYSESNSNMYPSVFIAGRTPSDPLGTLEQEVAAVNGTGSQIDTHNRWGDYSTMRIDPVDNCTFWYTTEYYMVTDSYNWSTQVASANFSNCSPLPTLTVSTSGSGTVTSTDGFINCPGVCSYSYPNNTQVTLNATPAGGWTFSAWSGACQGTGTCVVTMTQNLSAGATFFQNGVLLQFIPVPPCRLVDTRLANGGAGPIQRRTVETFDLPQLAQSGEFCPGFSLSTAATYSLNVTLLPSNGPVGYLTIWPAGQVQPNVSTMNSDGRVKANAAIVTAGVSGSVSVFVTDTSDVLLDIDGYFAPANSATLAFYPLTPCRLADTRGANGDFGGPYLTGGVNRDFPVLEATSCFPTGVTPVAYSLNFTAVPHGFLGYLTVCPTPSDPSQSCPLVSTLNSYGGQVVANAAIVPAGVMGAIRAFASNDTDLIIDINGYFALPGQGQGTALSLYPTVPCRVLDTRPPSGSGPFQFELNPPVDVLGSPCGVPSQSQAYVLNATVVPQGSLGYLTLWPDSIMQPTVSTLNAYDGVISSNMAIVPAGNNGEIDAWASPGNPNDPTDVTNLILDISSYFAP